MWPLGSLLRPLHSLSAAFRLQARGMALNRSREPYWDGWPKRSPKGWPYARWMKQNDGAEYMTKQALARLRKKNKGREAQAMRAEMRETPMYTASEEARSVPVAHFAGLRRRLLAPANDTEAR